MDPSDHDLELLGIDPSGDGAAEQKRLIGFLIDQGADAEELHDAVASGTLGTLALDIALRSERTTIPFSAAAAEAALTAEQAARLWRALGFPDPVAAGAMLTPSEVSALAFMGRMANGSMGLEATTQLARVIGGSTAQIAEATVDVFRIHEEMPRRHAGQAYPEAVQENVRMAAELVPELGSVIAQTLRAQLVAVSRTNWALDSERATITRERTVGFADLVDFTPRARVLSPTALAHALGRFESQVGDVVARFEGRVVKLIGDEAMFVVSDPARGCELALELGSTLSADPELPPVRIGVAAGPVVSRSGDYYGDTVNLAARLVKLAAPGEVLVSEALFAAGSRSVSFEAVQALELKGYEGRVAAYRLGPI